jgi:hypothetical protein
LLAFDEGEADGRQELLCGRAGESFGHGLGGGDAVGDRGRCWAGEPGQGR